MIAEHNGSTGAVVTDYVYVGSRMIANVSAGSTQYFLSDRLSARMTLDSSGNLSGRQSHLPFGEDFGESGTQEKHHFTSYERDSESGTDYAVNRGYAPAVGRFMRPDPYHGSGAVDAPQSLNRYAYVRNDPVNLNDPMGLIGGSITIIPGSWCVIWPAACGIVNNTFGLPRTYEPEPIPKGSALGSGWQKDDCLMRIASLKAAMTRVELMADSILNTLVAYGDKDNKFGEISNLFAAFYSALRQFPQGPHSDQEYASAGQTFGALGRSVYADAQVVDGLYSIYEDRTGRIWFASAVLPGFHFSYDKHTKSWAHYRLVDHLPAIRPNDSRLGLTEMYQDRFGRMMFGTKMGLITFTEHDKQWEILNTENSALPDNLITTIFEDRAGRIWVGTGKGIVVLER